MIKSFPSDKWSWGSWAINSSLADSPWSPCPKGKAALCQTRFEPVSNGHISLQRGVKVVLLSPNYTHLQGSSRQESRSLEDNIKLFFNFVYNFDTTHITAAEKHSVPLQIASYQRAACSYRWENHWSKKACGRLPVCIQREHRGKEEDFLKQCGSSWPQRNDLFRYFVIFPPTQPLCPWHGWILTRLPWEPKKKKKVWKNHYQVY